MKSSERTSARYGRISPRRANDADAAHHFTDNFSEGAAKPETCQIHDCESTGTVYTLDGRNEKKRKLQVSPADMADIKT